MLKENFAVWSGAEHVEGRKGLRAEGAVCPRGRPRGSRADRIGLTRVRQESRTATGVSDMSARRDVRRGFGVGLEGRCEEEKQRC